MTNIRALAAQALAPLLRHQGSLKTLMPAALDNCPERDRALLQNLCYGVMRYQPQLSRVSRQLLKKPFGARDYDVLALLWVGLFQLEHLRIPEHAAISETVDATDALKKSWAKGLINATLRRYQREAEQLKAKLSEDEIYQYNHPQWFISKLQHNWPDQWQQILQQNNESAPMTLRVNRSRVSRETYLDELFDEGTSAQVTTFSNDGIQLETPCDVYSLPGFHEGEVSVQDEAAQLSAELLDLGPGHRFLDACAAPGGKLCHALENQPHLASATAIELEASRATRIADNLERIRQEANVIVGDASRQDWWNGEAFDRILVDAPCSATGVIRRNPDIKYLRKGEDIATLSNLQLAVLKNCWQMLAAGGRLVYATCSIFPQENERLLKRFFAEVTDATHIPIDADWGIECDYGRQLFPQANGHDGFYYAVLEKQLDSEARS